MESQKVKFSRMADMGDFNEAPKWLWYIESDYCPIIVQIDDKEILWTLPDSPLELTWEDGQDYSISPLPDLKILTLEEWREEQDLDHPENYLNRKCLSELYTLYYECYNTYLDKPDAMRLLNIIHPKVLLLPDGCEKMEIVREMSKDLNDESLKTYIDAYFAFLNFSED